MPQQEARSCGIKKGCPGAPEHAVAKAF